MKHISLLLVGIQMLAVMPLAQAEEFTNKPFTDVPENSEHYTAIEYLRQQNILRGYLDGKFQPERRITRAEFVRLAVNPFFLNTLNTADCVKENVSAEASTIFFSDVPLDAWYGPELCAAKMREIIDGYPDGTFRPNEDIILVEAVKIAANIFVANVKNDEDGMRWYRPYLKWVSDLHAIPASLRSLTQPVKRGEMAELFYRLKAGVQDKRFAAYESFAQ